MRVAWLSRCPLGGLVALFCSLAATATAQQDATAPVAPQVLQYRRVYVPQEELTRFTRGYLPLRRDKLPELIDTIQRQARGAGDESAWIQSAHYSCQFAAGQLTHGQAKLTVTHPGADTSLLNLSPCALAIGDATWQGRAGGSNVAIVGNDLSGNLIALVGESGQLEFPWTLRGVTNDWGETSFAVALAPSPMNYMTVDLPQGFQPLADRGFVSQLSDVAELETGLEAGMIRWQIQLGGIHRFRLTVASKEAMRRREQLVNVQQNTLYRLANDGLEVECNIELDIQREPLEVLLLRVDSELQITTVRLGNRDVAWSLANDPDGRFRQLQVRFDEPLSGIHRTLQLTAIGPLHTGQAWSLPRILPRNAFWRQGTMALMVPETLGLRHLVPHDAQRAEAARSVSASPVAARHFELFAQDGYLEINVVRAVHKLTGTIGTTIDLEPGAMTAQIVADLSCAAGQHYLFEADVPNTWMLDSIASEPAPALEDHQYVAYAAKHKRLQIRLAQPLTKDQPVQLTIRAHRTPTLVLSADDFRPLQFDNLTDATELVAIAPDPSFRLNLSGDAGVERLDLGSLAPAQAELLEPRSGGVVFRDNSMADTMTIEVTRQDPTFAAENHVSVEVERDQLTETYQLICKPESTSVSRLFILLSQPRSGPIDWSLKSNSNAVLSATRVTEPSDRATRYSRTGELWELSLRAPEEKPFEIRGRRESPFVQACQVSLATLPDATAQDGWLAISSLDGTTLSLKASAVKPISSPAADPTTYTSTRAMYRYDVSRNAQVLVDRVDPRTAPAPLWAWQCQLDTQLLDSGELLHQATYLLESVGGTNFQIRLPHDSRMVNVEIDGQPITRPVQTEGDPLFTATLSPDIRFPRVMITYTTPDAGFRFFGTVDACLPDVDVPVLNRRWTVWLAPGLEPIADGAGKLYHRRPSWSERLLGPLAAPRHQRPFQLLSAKDWNDILQQRNGRKGELNPHAQLFLQWLGEQYLELKNRAPDRLVTWRELFDGYTRRAAQAPAAPKIWVGSVLLVNGSFRLDRPIEPVKTTTPIQVASNLLTQERLVVAASGQSVLLSHLDEMARVPEALQATEIPAAVNVRAESELAQRLESVEDQPFDTLIPLAAWVAQPAVAQSPWPGLIDTSRRGVAGRYWRACDVTIGPDGMGQLSILRDSTLSAIAWAILLVAAALGCIIGAYRPRYLGWFICGAVLLAIVVPPLWVPVTAHLVLGTALASLVIAVRYVIASVRNGSLESTDAAAGSAAGVAANLALVIFALLMALGARRLWAQTGTAVGATTGQDEIYRVVIPVDADMQPVGDYDYLPTPFYDALHRRATADESARQQWIVRRGVYRAVFNWTRQRTSLDLTSLTAVYEFELFKPLQRIAFPWTGDDSKVQILEARLAGQPIELIWNADHSAFFITVPPSGQTRLELVLLPTTTEESGSRRLAFPIPALARSLLRLEAPSDTPEIEVPSALGEARTADEDGTRVVELGPVRELRMQWASSAAGERNSRQLDAMQLSWIKVRPKDHRNSVILDTRFRIEAAGQPTDTVSFRVDPRLRLLPADEDPGFNIEETASQGGLPGSLVVRLREPTDREFTLPLQFWVLNTSGLGNLTVPQLELLDGRVQRRWLAVSVASDLEFTAGVSPSLAPMDAAEFLAFWGEAETVPGLCYRVEAEDPTWSIGTRARKTRCQVDQQLDISVGRHALSMVFQADINPVDGVVFQHELSVPRGFVVDSLAVRSVDDDEPIAANAKHDGSGSLTLFLGQGVRDAHHVRLEGTLDFAGEDDRVPVPKLTLRDVDTNSSLMRVYQRGNVLVSTDNAPPVEAVYRSQLGRHRDGFGRLIAAYDVSPDASNATMVALQIRPNEPAIQARLVTLLRRVNNGWEAIAELEASVTNAPAGVIDQFRLEIPSEWTEPFVLTPDYEYQVRPIPNGRRHLLIRPTLPVSDQFRVTVRGSLVLGANERGRAPNIVPLDVEHTDRFVVLPTQLDQQRIDWETSGLRPVTLREAIPNVQVDARNHVAYAVWSRPRAVIADVQRVAGERQINLADVHVMCQEDGSAFGIATFEIEPAGSASCTLKLPDGYELIQVLVEGVPASLIPLADQRWQVRLSSEQLPQQLAVLFRGSLSGKLSRNAQELHAPWVTDFDVVRTLWTVRGPRDMVLTGESLPEHRVDAAAQEAIRLRGTATLVQSAVETVLDSPASEVRAWYAPWAIRLACTNARLARARQLSDTAAITSDAVQQLIRQQELVSQRLNVAPSFEDYQRRTVEYPQLNDLIRFLGSENSVTERFAFIGPVSQVSVTRERATLTDWWRAVAGGAIVLLAGVLMWLGIGQTALANWLCQWPYAVGVLIGLLWWLYAVPSLLGWGVIAISLWGALRLPIPSRRVRAPEPANPT